MRCRSTGVRNFYTRWRIGNAREGAEKRKLALYALFVGTLEGFRHNLSWSQSSGNKDGEGKMTVAQEFICNELPMVCHAGTSLVNWGGSQSAIQWLSLLTIQPRQMHNGMWGQGATSFKPVLKVIEKFRISKWRKNAVTLEGLSHMRELHAANWPIYSTHLKTCL